MSMLYAGDPGSPPMGTILRDANGRRLWQVVAFDPLTGEVIDHVRPWFVARFPHPMLCNHIFCPYRWFRFWKWMRQRGVVIDGEISRRHWFAPAPISFEVPDPPCCHRSGS